jgi:hypothetical protein
MDQLIDGPNLKLSLGSLARLGSLIPTCRRHTAFDFESLTWILGDAKFDQNGVFTLGLILRLDSFCNLKLSFINQK